MSLCFGVLSSSDLNLWYDFVYEVFKTKTTRQYFVNHHENDPNATTESIFIAFIPDTKPLEIVGSVKVFHRWIQTCGGEMKCGGIGEVSTREDYRRRGIASTLLKHAIAFMERNGFQISSLHAAPSASAMYQSLGWQTIPMYHSFIQLRLDLSLHYPCEILTFNDLEVNQMIEIYHNFCKDLHGCNIRWPQRSDENLSVQNYWKHWVGTECQSHQCQPLAIFSEDNHLQAYLIIGPNQQYEGTTNLQLRVKEFVCKCMEDSWLLFLSLLREYVRRGHHSETSDQVTLDITMPHSLMMKLNPVCCTQASIIEKKEKSEVDNGYMYKLIDGQLGMTVQDYIHPDHHLAWKTDGF